MWGLSASCTLLQEEDETSRPTFRRWAMSFGFVNSTAAQMLYGKGVILLWRTYEGSDRTDGTRFVKHPYSTVLKVKGALQCAWTRTPRCEPKCSFHHWSITDDIGRTLEISGKYAGITHFQVRHFKLRPSKFLEVKHHTHLTHHCIPESVTPIPPQTNGKEAPLSLL